MNVTLKNIDPVNAIIKMDIVKDDYAKETEKALKNLRQNASDRKSTRLNSSHT